MIHRSIASRTAAWVFLGASLVLIANALLMLALARTQVMAQAHREAAALTDSAASKIQGRLDSIAHATRMLATIVAKRGNGSEPLLRDTLQANPDIDGVAAAFLPDASADAPPFSPFVRRQARGAAITRNLSEDRNPYWNSRWFKHGLDCVNGCWQQPFFSNSRQRLLINYSAAIRNNGHTLGIINTDVTIDWLQRTLDALDKPGAAYAFVLNSEGEYLAHDNPALLGQAGRPELLAILGQQSPGALHLDTAQNPQIQGPIWVYYAPIKGTDWRLGLVLPENQVTAGIRQVVLRSLAPGLIALLLLALLTRWIIRRAVAPLGVLADRAEHVARGELDFRLPAPRRRDEVGRLTAAFERMRQQLALHLQDLARVEREKQRLASELEIAHQIQFSLLPDTHYQDTRGAHFEVQAMLRPARAVGGDLYCYFMLEPRRFFVLIGDVSDKGIPAALFMAQTITLAKALAATAKTPGNLLHLLNQELCQHNESCMFVTLLCGLLDADSGALTLSSAGHEPPILCGRGAPQPLEIPTSAVLGLYEDTRYTEHVFHLQQGETLVTYTDGITEACDPAQQLFGMQRTLDSLAAVPPTAAASGFIEKLLGDVDRFAAGAPQADDITLLALRWQLASTHIHSTELQIVNTPAAVASALDQCVRWLAETGIPDDQCDDVRLVLEELLINTVTYGYPDHRNGKLQIQLHVHDGSLQIELCDDADPFDPLQAAPPVLTGDLAEHERIGGLGIHLVRNLTCGLRYTRRADGNFLQLQFPRSGSNGLSP